MIRRTYGSVKGQLARVTQNGMCADSSQLLARVNEAQERLLNKGLYAGTYGRYSVCVYGGCITLPREFESILGYNFSGVPAQVYNQWYEFMANGPGVAPAGAWRQLIDRGFTSTFRPIESPKYIRVYTDLIEDFSSTILFRGFNGCSNQVQTIENSEYIEGERVNLTPGIFVSGFSGTNASGNGLYQQTGFENSKPKYQNTGGWVISNNGSLWRFLNPVGTQVAISNTNSDYPWQKIAYTPNLTLTISPKTSANAFKTIDFINKTVTKGWVRVHAVDPTTGSESCIAMLAPDETLPQYRRYAIPGFESQEGSTVTVLAKRKFIPIVTDDDDLIVTNLGAIKMMAIAIEKEENNNLAEAQLYEDKAVELLREELKEVEGANIGRPQVQMEMFAMGEIPNMA
jgi:hypothetical protein